MTEQLNIAAPFSGTAVAMAFVPDPVFSQEIVGPGIAILAPQDQKVSVHAPISGVITAVFPHAFSIEGPNGHNVLVHLGIDTVELRGAGFTQHASVGDQVNQGDLLIDWDTSIAHASGHSLVCPVVAVQAQSEHLEVLVDADTAVTQNDLIARWN